MVGRWQEGVDESVFTRMSIACVSGDLIKVV